MSRLNLEPFRDAPPNQSQYDGYEVDQRNASPRVGEMGLPSLELLVSFVKG